MRSPLWVPQTTQEAESDVEQVKKSQLQARTEHGARSLGECESPYSTCQLQRKETLQHESLSTHSTVLVCNSVYIFFFYQIFRRHGTLLFLPIFLYSSRKTHAFFPLEGSALCAELSHVKSTIITLRKNS